MNDNKTGGDKGSVICMSFNGHSNEKDTEPLNCFNDVIGFNPQIDSRSGDCFQKF